jgi:acyl-homoserine-lactone acylase
VYADREHNIYYLCNGLFPYRNPSYDWKKVLPGDTSATLWEEKFHPLNELPQVLNPECGYVFNTNNTPFNATCQEENLNPDDYNPTMGFQTGDNNRSLRFQYLMNQYGRMGYDDFLDVKYDNGIMNPAYNSFIQNIEKLFSLDPTKYPDIADAIKLLAEWDRMTNIESVPASIAVYCIKYVVDDLFNKGILPGSSTVEPDLFAESIREAKKHMIKHFGKLEVPLGEIQRHIRGGKSYPMAGGPDVLAAMHTDYYKNGILKTRHGESYIELVKFSENGVEIETVNTFGASSKKDSPHYTDQMELFVAQKTKKMTLDKETIFREAKKIYHPK